MSAISWQHWNAWAETWAGWMLVSLFDTAVALIVVLGIWLLVRRHVSPRWCYLLFLLVPLKMLAPVELPWLPALRADCPALVTRGAETRSVALAESAAPMRRTVESPIDPAVETSAVKSTKPVTERPTARTDTTDVRPTTVAWLMIGWAGVVCLLAARLVWSQIAMAKLLRDAQPVDEATDEDGRLPDKRRPGRQTVRLWISDKLAMPGVVGLFRPRVVIPAKLYSNLSPQQLKCIIAHEQHHIHWRDTWVALGERLVRMVQFFNPVLWCAAYMTHIYRERSCDDASLLAVEVDRKLYGSTLLAVLECAHADRVAAPPAVALLERSGDHKRRIRRIMTEEIRWPGLRLWSTCVLCVVAIAVLPNLRVASGIPVEPSAYLKATTAALVAGEAEKTAHNQPDELAEEPLEIVPDKAFEEVSYDVADLARTDTDVKYLVDIITATVLPRTWEGLGGKGIASVDAETRKLKARNCAGAHAGVKRLLKALRTIGSATARPDETVPAPKEYALFQQGGQVAQLYSVSSLVRLDNQLAPATREGFDQLIQVTHETVDVEDWADVGGTGTFAVWPAAECLVIVQSPEAHTRIMRLYTLLHGLPAIDSEQRPASTESILLPESWGAITFARHAAMPAGGAGKNYETRVYPLHDLLPSQILPTLASSPRGVGLEQLTAWIFRQVFSQVDPPLLERDSIGAATFLTKAVLIVTADSSAHLRIAAALAGVRARKRIAATDAERAAVLQPLFAPAYCKFWSGSQTHVPGDWRPNRIYLFGACEADQQLRQLSGVAEYVEQVALIESDVTDDGLQVLAQISMIGKLILWSDNVTDEGVGHVVALNRLSSLSLHSARVTDGAVPRLAEWKRNGFGWLDISHTAISTAGVKNLLEASESVRRGMLIVKRSQTDPDGLASLRQRCPGLRIVD